VKWRRIDAVEMALASSPAGRSFVDLEHPRELSVWHSGRACAHVRRGGLALQTRAHVAQWPG
jgi:hypothetical protein